MSRLKGAVARVRALLFARAADARMEEEFAFHVALETEENVRRGYSRADARRLALMSFGGVERHREEMRDGRAVRLLAELSQDIRYALRALRRAPAFALIAVFIIALGIGATTALFSVANALLLRPLPVQDPAALFQVQEVRWGAVSTATEGRRIPYARYEAYAHALRDEFTGLAAHDYTDMSVRTENEAVSVSGVVVSPNYFEVVGVRPAIGRFFSDAAEPSVVLGHHFWQQQYGGRADVVGQALHVNGRAYTVAGVVPARFAGVMHGVAVDVWIPFRAYSAADEYAMSRWVAMFGRLREPAELARANSAVDAVAKRIPPDEKQTRVERGYLSPLTGLPEQSRADVAAFVSMLVAASLLVMLIGCANVAGMLLARGVARRREMAVRLSMGAGRGRVIRQLLTESVVLFFIGAAGGIAIALLALSLLTRFALSALPLTLDFSIDLRVLSYALALAAVTGVIFGLAPAVRAARADVVSALKGGGSAARTRLRDAFVAAQLALAVVLLATAGLFVRGLQRGLDADPGFAPDRIITAAVDLEPHGYDEERGRFFYDELRRRVAALPNVEAVTIAEKILLSHSQRSNDVSSVGSGEPKSATSQQNVVDSAFFRVMQIPIIAGRAFTSRDAHGAQRVVVVNEALARRLWDNANPVGERLKRGDAEFEVIGVARNGLYVALNEQPRAYAFYSAAQEYSPDMVLHVRGNGATARVIEDVRREVAALDADVAVTQAMSMHQSITLSVLPHRVAAGFIGVFGLLGLLLAGAGVYGVIAFQVAQRMREFGIRLALGAAARDLVQLVVRRGFVLAAVGAAIGLAIAAALSQLLRSMLFGLNPLDPLTFGAAAVSLAAVALLASWIPARRALRTDPIVSLRSD